MMNLKEIASCLNLNIQENGEVLSVGIDSRKVTPNQLFIAIRGERWDGHDFVREAQARGAVAVVCDRAQSNIDIPQLVVPDTLHALADIARFYRRQLDCKVIALTGSNGKTTVKEMIAKILPPSAFSTPGNFNNHIGAPLSVLQMNASHDYAVFELGANHKGEIAYTVDVVQPQVALINNIGTAHIGEFGSVEGIARAKGEIYQGLGVHGTAVINDDDEYHHFWDHLLENKKMVRFSAKHSADIYAKNIAFNQNNSVQFELVTPDGGIEIQLAVPGQHHLSNALAAASCTYSIGMSLEAIKAGLEDFSGVSGRMAFLSGRANAVIIDDTYNANLRSVLTALEVLSKRQGIRVFVFGDMSELGEFSEDHHREVGLAARQLGIDRLLTCGTHSRLAALAFGEGATHHISQDDLLRCIELNANTTVLVKGSRASAMEKIVHQLM